MSAGDRDERLLHRLEAFSDIVIGFSLAQVTLSLSPATFFEHRTGLIAFFVTFLGVSTIWWLHNRLFALYFVPNRVGLVLNFAALATMILFVFSIQLWIAPNPDPRALPFYFGTYGIVYLLLGVLYLIGSRQRRPLLSSEDYARGLRFGVRGSLIGAGMLLAAGGLLLSHANESTAGIIIATGLGLAIVLIKVLQAMFPILRKPTKIS